MQYVSIIQNNKIIIAQKSLDEILSEIKSGLYCDTIFALRRHIHAEQPNFYKKLIRTLPSFTPAGIFYSTGNQLVLSKYSYYVLLDIGWITPMQMFIASKMLEDNPYTLAYFRSPSGKSLKIIVEVISAWAYHSDACLEVALYFTNFLKIPIVKVNNDYSDLCYYSYDPALYHNPDNLGFKIDTTDY
jgi:hypothetical protein